MNESDKRPEIVLFAGPNGSGKSTFTEYLKPNFDYINADEIKKNLKCSDIEAAQIAEQQREEHLKKNLNFCFETVLSTDRNLKLLKRAKDQGYFIRCYYVITFDPIININRIKLRALNGGHDVPADKVISRYSKSLALIKEVIPVCDICHIYDNSSSKPYRIFKRRKDEFYFDESEDWLFEDIVSLTGINTAINKKLN